MADAADLAGDAIEMELAHALHARRNESDGAVSSRYCEECGEAIPKARRESVVGVRLCVACKSAQEHTLRMVPRQ